MFARSKKSYSLGEAAQRAFDAAKHENLALAHVAEQSGEPLFWFALNILSQAAVEGRRTGAVRPEPLDRGRFEEFLLDAEMTRLCAPGRHDQDITELSLSRGEFEKYMRWARTVR